MDVHSYLDLRLTQVSLFATFEMIALETWRDQDQQSYLYVKSRCGSKVLTRLQRHRQDYHGSVPTRLGV